MVERTWRIIAAYLMVVKTGREERGRGEGEREGDGGVREAEYDSGSCWMLARFLLSPSYSTLAPA